MDSFAPGGVFIVSICIFVVGILFWFTVVYAYVPLTLADSRKFWLGRLPGGWTLFEAYVFVCLLLGYWLLFSAIGCWVRFEMPSLPVFFLYLLSAVVLGQISHSLYVMRTTALNDQLFSWMQHMQDVRPGPNYVGRVRNKAPENCGPTPEPCVLVELTDGRLVVATMSSRLNYPETEIVIVDDMIGEKTHEHYYYQVDYYIQGDTEFRWRRQTAR